MATIAELQNQIPGAFTIPEIESYGADGVVYTIKAAQVQQVGGESPEDKPVLSFKEHAKVLVLNKTRAQQLADLFGAANDPSGKQVRLVVERCKVGNRNLDMIVIKEV